MEKEITQLINSILQKFEDYDDYVLIDVEVNKLFVSFENLLNLKQSKEKNKYINTLEKNIYNLTTLPKIYLLSILLNHYSNIKYYEELLKITLNDLSLNINSKYFLLYQCIGLNFTNDKFNSKNTKDLQFKIYKNIYHYYKNNTLTNFNYIQKEDRNKDLIFIFTSQFLSLNHAPTKSAIDRAYNLKKLGKEVIIINTTELLTSTGRIPFYNAQISNIEKDYELINSFDYLDEQIPYFQCSDMPSIDGILNILNIINEYKPYLIFSIGSYNLTADICSNIIPVATIATVFSGIPTTFSQFHITGKEITSNDFKEIEDKGFTSNCLISHKFTSSFKPQEKRFMKKDFNIPEDKFIITIIGARLHSELKVDFLNLLLDNFSSDVHLLFVGHFYNYEDLTENNSTLKENSTHIGFQDDILAVLDLCDLYLNPRRAGGGMSSVEALYKGVPVITYKNGDVYINVGNEFSVDNDQELLEKIKLYKDNKEFYERQVSLGKDKVIKLTDTKNSLKELLIKIENSPLFK